MALRLLFTHEYQGQRRADVLLQGDAFLVGRADPARATAPDVDLAPDLTCSRQHARLWIADERLWIEDTNSRHGTFVGGRDIRGESAIELPFATPVKTGELTWLIVPEQSWHVNFDAIFICADVADMINFAAHHSGVPLVRDFRVSNLNAEASSALSFVIEIPGFSGPCKFDVAPLAGFESRAIRVSAIVLDSTVLRAQIEPTRAAWRVEMEMRTGTGSVGLPRAGTTDSADGTRRIYSAQRELTILGYWDWSFQPAMRKTIAVFSTPRNPAIERAVQEAQRNAPASWGEAHTFRELLRSGNAQAELSVLRALYEHLRNDWDLHYEDPKASREAAGAFQTIRSAHRILPNAAVRTGSATCIDLALVFAACLENVGLCPLIVFLGNRGQAPRHALIAVWSGTTPGPYPVSDDADFIRAEIDAGRMHVLECTGVALGARRDPRKLSFEEARESAQAALAQAEWISAVDVLNLRPPAGRIMPLENPYEPEVARLFDGARQIAVATRARNVEMVHLLYAAVLGETPVAASIVNRMGLEREAIRHTLNYESAQRADSVYPPPTANVVECRQLAHSFARHQESPAVREQDLLWALLQKAPHSIRLVEACVKSHIDLELFRQYLAELHPSPLLDSTSTYTSILVGKADTKR
jgi:hypothetical protein